MDRRPWKCPECGGMVAPHVDVHWCGKPDGGVTARRPAAPRSPFAGASVTTTLPPGTTVTLNAGGTGAGLAWVGERGPELVTTADVAQIGDGLRSVDGARRELGDGPWGLSAA